jgi:hypothetical protein
MKLIHSVGVKPETFLHASAVLFILRAERAKVRGARRGRANPHRAHSVPPMSSWRVSTARQTPARREAVARLWLWLSPRAHRIKGTRREWGRHELNPQWRRASRPQPDCRTPRPPKGAQSKSIVWKWHRPHAHHPPSMRCCRLIPQQPYDGGDGVVWVVWRRAARAIAAVRLSKTRRMLGRRRP